MQHRIRQGLLALLLPAATLAAAPTATDAAQGGGEKVAVIVTLASGVPTDQADDVARAHDADLGFVYEHVLGGFSAQVPQARMAGLREDRRVAAVELDRVMTTQAETDPTGIRRSYATEVTITGTTTKLIGSGKSVDVDIAIVDTGIAAHPDLHVVGGTNCSGGSPMSATCVDGSWADGNGHGTHVAGTAAAKDDGAGVVGVAPGARLWGVKVLKDSGSGYTSWIIAGIDWVVANGEIEVLNMSLGGSGVSSSYETAIGDAVNSGVVVVVAAGNSDSDADGYSPAYVDDAVTVSALADFDGLAGGLGSPTCRTDQDDTLADFSNWGAAAIDLAAPGVCILSTWNDGGYHTISGTSMAAPHVAGAAGLLASGRTLVGRTDVEGIVTTLVSEGNLDWTDDSGDGVQERLLDLTGMSAEVVTAVDDGGGTTENSAPTASFTSSCTDLTCSFTDTSTDDGTIASWSWTFGDGSSSTAQDPQHTYAAAGTYTVSLTVTDDAGATGTTSQTVSVTASSSTCTKPNPKACK